MLITTTSKLDYKYKYLIFTGTKVLQFNFDEIPGIYKWGKLRGWQWESQDNIYKLRTINAMPVGWEFKASVCLTKDNITNVLSCI